MPTSKRQRENMKLKRETILEKALHHFADYGYDKTTIQNVAKDSGVSFGSVFTYFENKESLFQAVVTEPLKEFESEVMTFNEAPDDTMAEIRAMVERHIRFFAQSEKYLRMIQQIIGQPAKYAGSFVVLDDLHMRLIGKLVRLIEHGQSRGEIRPPSTPRMTAVSYTSFLMGIRLNVTDPEDDPIWERFVPCGIQLFGPLI